MLKWKYVFNGEYLFLSKTIGCNYLSISWWLYGVYQATTVHWPLWRWNWNILETLWCPCVLLNCNSLHQHLLSDVYFHIYIYIYILIQDSKLSLGRGWVIIFHKNCGMWLLYHVLIQEKMFLKRGPGPLLLTWINFNTSMDKQLHAKLIAGWN